MSKSLKRALQKIADDMYVWTCPICGAKGDEPKSEGTTGEVIMINGNILRRYADVSYPCGCKVKMDFLTKKASQRGAA